VPCAAGPFITSRLYIPRGYAQGIRRRTQAVALISVSIVLFLVMAPVVYTSKFAYSVHTSMGCSDVCSGYNMNQVCYEALSYHFLGFGGAICHYERAGPLIS